MGKTTKDSEFAAPGSEYRSGHGQGYLPRERSGVPWMLDPASPALARHVQNQSAGPDAPASYEDCLSDAGELKDLLAQRHVAVVLDPAKRELTDRIVDDWVSYLHRVRPTTRAGCAGSLGPDLGLALRDAHLRVRHSTGARTRKAQQGQDPGPAWTSRSAHGIRIARIRTLDASFGADQELLAGAANHAEDFSHRRIVVDLRGNGGGNDDYVLSWMAPHAPALAAPACRERTMTLQDGTPVFLWNYLSYLTQKGLEIPGSLRQLSTVPAADDELRIRDSYEYEADDGAWSPSLSGGRPGEWDGQMIVVIDGGTGSSGESAALMLRAAFGAVIAGGPSYGIIDYGNAVPYFLPASGLEIHLPSQANDWGVPIDFAGIQPDVPMSVHAPAEWIASQFDEIFSGAGKPPVHT